MKYLNFHENRTQEELFVNLEKNYVTLLEIKFYIGYFICFVLVKNLSYEKKISSLITFDSWTTNEVIEAKYSGLRKLNYGTFDCFSFEVDLNLSQKNNKKFQVDFAISYQSGGQMFWDNNCFQNYSLEFIFPVELEKVDLSKKSPKSNLKKVPSSPRFLIIPYEEEENQNSFLHKIPSEPNFQSLYFRTKYY